MSRRQRWEPLTGPICKCQVGMCRAGWDVRVYFESDDAAREAGWWVSGDWPSQHFRCPEHAAELREGMRKLVTNEHLREIA